MTNVKVKCVGKSPILMDQMTEETLESLRTQVRVDVKKDRSVKDVAAEKIYRENGEDSRVGLPSSMLFASLARAGQNVKNGTKQISTAKKTALPGLLSIEDFFMPFINIEGNDDKAWVVDKRRGVMHNKGNDITVCIIRPRFDKWEFEVSIEYDETKVDSSVLKALFENAGSFQGLASFRPNCGGQFGRFVVVSWEKKKEK